MQPFRPLILALISLSTFLSTATWPAHAQSPLPWNPRPPGIFREIWPVDKAEEAALRSEVGPEYTTLHTDHFSITHADRVEVARYRGQILESVYAAFVLFFDSRGFELDVPPALLQTLFFRTRAEFVEHLGIPALPDEVEGLYQPAVSRAYFFDTLGRSEVRKQTDSARKRQRELKALRREVQAMKEDAFVLLKRPMHSESRHSKAEAMRLIEKELRTLSGKARRFRKGLGQHSIETMCHEGVHQLSDRMGVFRSDRFNPRWITEGLALFFEPSRNGYLLETGAIHWRRWDELMRAHKRGERTTLTDLLTNDELFFDWTAAHRNYSEAWSLVHFLATERTDGLMNYLRALKTVDPKSARTRRIEIFEAAFDTSLAEIEVRWRAHVDGLGKPPT